MDELAPRRKRKSSRQFLEAMKDHPFITIVFEDNKIVVFFSDDVSPEMLEKLHDTLYA